MRFLDTPSGTACVLDGDSRARPAGDRYIVLEPEDEPDLILKRCPDLAASFKLISGAYHITYGDAMILFAGFLRLAPQDLGTVAPLWSDYVISAECFTRAWRLCMADFFRTFNDDDGEHDTIMPFSWFLQARAVSAALESDGCLVHSTDFEHCWSCCSLSSPTSASGQPVELQLSAAALAAGDSSFASIAPSSQGSATLASSTLPKWVAALRFASGNLVDKDGSFLAVVLLEYFVGAHFSMDHIRPLAVSGEPSVLQSGLELLHSAWSSSEKSQSSLDTSKLRPGTVAAGVAAFLRSIFPPEALAAYHSDTLEREAQFGWLCKLSEARQANRSMELFIDESAHSVLKALPALRALLGLSPADWGVSLSSVVRIFAPADSLEKNTLSLHSLSEAEDFLKRRLARIVEEDLQQLSIQERIKKLRSQIELEVTAEKSAPSSSSSVDADKSGVAAGSFTWPKAYQGALMRMQSEEPYVSIVSEVCACPRPRDAVELIIKGASRLHPARRPSAILLSLYYDSKKDPPLVDSRLKKIINLREGFANYLGSVAMMSLSLPDCDRQLFDLASVVRNHSWDKLDFLSQLVLPARRRAQSKWSLKGHGYEGVLLPEHVGLIDLSIDLIAAFFVGIGVPDAGAHRLDMIPNEANVTSVRNVLVMMAQTLKFFNDGDLLRIETIKKANRYLWKALLGEFCKAYNHARFGAPDAVVPITFVQPGSAALERYLKYLNSVSKQDLLERQFTSDRFEDIEPSDASSSKGKKRELDDDGGNANDKTKKKLADSWTNPRLEEDGAWLAFDHELVSGERRTKRYNMETLRKQLVDNNIVTSAADAAKFNIPALVARIVVPNSNKKKRFLEKAAALCPEASGELPPPKETIGLKVALAAEKVLAGEADSARQHGGRKRPQKQGGSFAKRAKAAAMLAAARGAGASAPGAAPPSHAHEATSRASSPLRGVVASSSPSILRTSRQASRASSPTRGVRSSGDSTSPLACMMFMHLMMDPIKDHSSLRAPSMPSVLDVSSLKASPVPLALEGPSRQMSNGAIGARRLLVDGTTSWNSVLEQPVATPPIGPFSAEVRLRLSKLPLDSFLNLPLKVGTLFHLVEMGFLLMNGCIIPYQVSIGAYGARRLLDEGSTMWNAVSEQPLVAPLMRPPSTEVILRFSNLPLKVGTLSHVCGKGLSPPKWLFNCPSGVYRCLRHSRALR